jgi:hypothetical protein
MAAAAGIPVGTTDHGAPTPPAPVAPRFGGGPAAVRAPVPVPGTPPGSHLPGVQATGAVCRDGRIVAVTRLAHAAPGKPDGEVDTRPLYPIWRRPPEPWTPPWQQPGE